MSDPDRPQAPQPRGARPSLPSPPPSRGRDLARSSTDGWPSVDEWRDHRARQRTSTPPPDPQASTADSQPRVDESLTGTADPQPGGADLQPEVDGSQADTADSPALARGRFSDNGEATADEPRTSRITSDHQTATSTGQAAASGRAGDDTALSGEGGAGWHSEVLAGSSWFAEEQPGGGKAGQKRTGRGRRSGRSNRRSGKGTRERGWPSEGLGTGTGPHAEGAAGFAPDGKSFAESGWDSESLGGFGQGGESSARSGRGDESGSGGGRDADPESAARAICLRLLTMAPKTRAQLAEALRKRNVPDEAAEAVLSRFSELGLINDEAFAAAWVDSRHHGRGLAKRALAAELRHRGVDTDTVKEAVERLDPDQEAETARRLVERKLASTRSLDPQTRTRRLAGMLARKGYSAGLAFRVIREALEAEGIDVEEDFS
ncbi:recombination regulator RecX [Nonomuraea sp. NPDC049784]|uniref:recombination regulator RecX n=1 Tax=Nonomuraea sp. NPDC049784 TaxID=3154361 RepID=UPI003407C035